MQTGKITKKVGNKTLWFWFEGGSLYCNVYPEKGDSSKNPIRRAWQKSEVLQACADAFAKDAIQGIK